MPDWHWEPVTDDLLDGLSPAALAAVRQVAEELAVRESMIFLDGREFTGEPPGLRTIQRGPLMLVYLTDVRGERVVTNCVSPTTGCRSATGQKVQKLTAIDSGA